MTTRSTKSSNWLEVLDASLRLGLTSFGGPIAHLGYFRDEYVVRRKWLDEKTYADLVALCQFLPGPASSQVGIAIGQLRAGYAGALAAWAGFTLPSAVALVLFAYGVDALGSALGSGWLHGLKVVAVAVVAQAVLGMMRSLAPDRERATLAVVAAAIVLAMPSAWGQIGAILLGGVVGILLPGKGAPTNHVALPLAVSRWSGACLLIVFFVLLIGLPLLAASQPSQSLNLFDAFYRAGSLVFGGGHVVLPLLQASVVPPGWVSNDAFLAGYGAAQAVPVIHLRGLSRRRDGAAAKRLVRRGAVPGRGLPAVVLAGDRYIAVLGSVAPAAGRAGSAARRQRGCSRSAARSALQSGVDGGHHEWRRFCARRCRLSAAVYVASPALAGGGAKRTRRGGDRGPLSKVQTAAHRFAFCSFNTTLPGLMCVNAAGDRAL
jgi:putative chromate ion transporter